MISVEHNIFFPLESSERLDASRPHSLFLCDSVCIVDVGTNVTRSEHPCKTRNVSQRSTSTRCLTTVCRDLLPSNQTELHSQSVSHQKEMSFCVFDCASSQFNYFFCGVPPRIGFLLNVLSQRICSKIYGVNLAR